jgi:hypothetical protein
MWQELYRIVSYEFIIDQEILNSKLVVCHSDRSESAIRQLAEAESEVEESLILSI